MQTFMPYKSFMQSAKALDRQRLGKQRVECLQILNALHTGKGWVHHPATRMWRGHEHALIAYGTAVCLEWQFRGYKDSCLDKILAMLDHFPLESSQPPPWVGDDAIHASHRSNLLRKDPVHYGQLGWTEPPDLPYVWP